MNKCPKIGDRVSYPGGLVVGPCTGVVTAIYKKTKYDADLYEDAMTIDDEDDYFRALRHAERGLEPESKWSVAIKVDRIPNKWCYGKNNQFAPEVRDLTKVRK